MQIKQKLIKLGSIIISCAFMFSPIIYTEVNNSIYDVKLNIIQVHAVNIFFLCAPTLCILISIIFFINCFKKEGTLYKKLKSIITTYVIVIISFSNIYYLESYIGDYMDSMNKYYYYSQFGDYFTNYDSILRQKKDKLISSNYQIDSIRAFKGISRRLWSGVDYRDLDYCLDEVKFTDEIIMNANMSLLDASKNINFIYKNRINVYMDCLYFSTITIATVGFGDISPNIPLSKFTVTIQTILGQALIILAVGFFFYNLGNKEKNLEQDIEYYL